MQQFLRFSTDDLPERDRVAVWSEVFGRYVLAIDSKPSVAFRFRRTPLCADCRDYRWR
jgi:hypothetical protein